MVGGGWVCISFLKTVMKNIHGGYIKSLSLQNAKGLVQYSKNSQINTEFETLWTLTNYS